MVLEKVIDTKKQEVIKKLFFETLDALKKEGVYIDLRGYISPKNNEDYYEYLYKIKTFCGIKEEYKESIFEERFGLFCSDKSNLLWKVKEEERKYISEEDLPVLVKGLYSVLKTLGFENYSYKFLDEHPYTKEYYWKNIYQFEKKVTVDNYDIYITIVF